MKSTTLSAALLLAAQQCAATHSHRLAHTHFDRRHHSHGHAAVVEDRSSSSNSSPMEHAVLDARETSDAVDAEAAPAVEVKRNVQCSLPAHADLVEVTKDKDNKGFAMSPDQPCNSGMYCPIACRSGMVMAQWEPGSSYATTSRMNGGLYCDNGTPTKPFPNSPYCVEGSGTVKAVNKCGKVVSFCQTVLPGNEAMLIPTDVTGTTTLAVPDSSYWGGTAAHFYVNPPGVGSGEGCVWGSEDKNVGNWSPYVAGANTVANGDTYVQISWNPIYEASKWASNKPSYGIKIECDGTCNGLPCEIDPSKTGLKNVKSNTASAGAGGANFCVVTVAKGSSANIVVFNTDGSTGGGDDSSSSSSTSEAPKPSSTSSTKAPSTSSESSSKTTSSSSQSQTTTTGGSGGAPTVLPGVFHENGTSTHAGSHSSSSGTVTSPPTGTAASSTPSQTSTKSDAASREKGGAAIAGLIIALVAAAWLY